MARGVRGAEDLARLAADLKAAGDKGLRRELYRGLSRALAPAKPAVMAAMRADLPHRGGLAEEIALTTILKRQIKTGPRNVGGYIKAIGKHDIANLNRGRLRHPVFGNREVWRTQRIKPGFFDHPLEELKPEVTVEFVAVLDRVERMLARK